MANTIITPSVIARLAYANLYNNAVMSSLVHRDYDADFQGQQGDTVTVRKPAVFTANSFTSTISVQNATESSVPVVLNNHLDVSFAVTSRELTLSIQDFNAQLIVPAVQALRQKIDQLLLAERSNITQVVGEIPTAGGLQQWDDPRVLVDAGKVLNQAKVPVTDRAVVAGPVTATAWLKDPLFHQAQQLGSTDGLRDASLGRKFGFDIYMDQNVVDPGAEGAGGGTEASLAFHRSAFALVSRTLALPMAMAPSRAPSSVTRAWASA